MHVRLRVARMRLCTVLVHSPYGHIHASIALFLYF